MCNTPATIQNLNIREAGCGRDLELSLVQLERCRGAGGGSCSQDGDTVYWTVRSATSDPSAHRSMHRSQRGLSLFTVVRAVGLYSVQYMYLQ